MGAVTCALVTGGSKGIGRAISLQLAQDHQFHIIINFSNDKKAAHETLSSIQNLGGTGELMKFDVRHKNEVDTVLDLWKEKNPQKEIHVLVNNAGRIKDKLLIWMKEDDWDDVIDTNLKGMYNVTHHVLPDMLLRRKGRIINISSLSGVKGMPGQMNYAASKAGMIGATKALAQEVAKRSITVNAVAPGFIETNMLQNLAKSDLKKWIPMNRIGTPQEVAYLVSFLASDRASYITGEVININGGIYS